MGRAGDGWVTRLRQWWRRRALWQCMAMVGLLTLLSPMLVQIPIIVFVPVSRMDLRVGLYYLLSYVAVLAGLLTIVWMARPWREDGRG
jgi:hypothetical protein